MEQYQWQDKTIYPVCTHEGSRFGDSLNELSEIAQGASIERGLAVRGVCAYDTDQAIKNWLNNYDQKADDQPMVTVSYWHPQYKDE
ncbi:NADPH-dependent FMN reductase family protein [Paucilactobacillus wasatchensis]|uniref:Uncharacterized protein n=1 Tax=Paucilactobacillus wasatchensis TaxID=1335616 RepID=A0A0D0Y2U6_9LACO|nr:hypothetical protein [Paucilactobacillus wasatchensis]KIS02568.1 hypothetical protein WDC_1884 [Paucilactobacillus wasatchensis]